MLVKNAGSMLKCSIIKGKLINGQHRALWFPQDVLTLQQRAFRGVM